MKQELKEKLENITQAEAMIIVFSKWKEGDLIASALLEWEQFVACESLQEKGILKTCGMPGMLKITKDFELLRDELRKNFKISFTV